MFFPFCESNLNYGRIDSKIFIYYVYKYQILITCIIGVL
jgi:hypothetical protein